MASPRRQGREVALQVLCAIDANPDLDAGVALELYVSHLLTSEDEDTDLPAADAFDRAFTETLVAAASRNRDRIDETITQISRTWRLDRMARVDRNVLRLAVAEILFLPDVPARVSINEAVELAKRFGAAESSAFVNGLLDSVIKTLDVRK
jgi:transcription antitermination protein NusB